MRMNDDAVDIVAVVGACVPERHDYAKKVAGSRGRVFISASRIATEKGVIEDSVELMSRMPQSPGMVMEFPMEGGILDIIGVLADPAGETQLSEVICVLDALHLMEDLWGDDYIALEIGQDQPGEDEATYVSRAELIVKQIEYASTLVMVNWRALPRRELTMLMALISHLSPQVHLQLAGDRIHVPFSAETYSPEQTRAGWTQILNNTYRPRAISPRVAWMRYEQFRPFHPGRLKDILDQRVEAEEFGRVIRSAGFCRLATRPHITAQWEHVGQMIALAPLSFDHQIADPDSMLAFGQDLAFIGLDLDTQALSAALDEAALDDDELAAGPMLWATFQDPFPDWQTAPNL